MRYKLDISERVFHFKEPARTSRGEYTVRRSWIVTARCADNPQRVGVGECAPLPDLSCDASPHYAAVLRRFCDSVEPDGDCYSGNLCDYPSMLFGIETALLNVQRGSLALFDTPFSRGDEGIPINGLVWMGDYETMLQRLDEKIRAGFSCVKLKIGAIDFEYEVELLKVIRNTFNSSKIQIRVDANGGFSPADVMQRLDVLARYDIHSIEQPVRQKQWDVMARVCRESPVPVALDEELIGVNRREDKIRLLDSLRPQFIVLKPSLHGGMRGTAEWHALASERGIGSWITSALEGNVGLNAVAQLAAKLYGPHVSFPQGLGTGQLFTDNMDMPIGIRGNSIWALKSL